MRYINLLERYNELKANKGDPSDLAELRVKTINTMYEEMEDFKTNNQVKILLNEELSYYRKLRRVGTKICSFEMTVPYVLYRYLVENGDNPNLLKFDFKKVEIDEINQRLVQSVYEYNLLEYFTHKFAHINHSERIQSLTKLPEVSFLKKSSIFRWEMNGKVLNFTSYSIILDELRR